MKHYRHLLLLLALLLGHAAWAQYDPQNPDEPGTRPWRLTLLATPNDAGYFNLSAQSQHAAGEEMQLRAYSNNNYKFVRWEDAQGNILATESSFSYAMPARDVTLTARYEYTPNNPDEPQQTSIKRHLFLRTNPEGAGWFNLSSDNNIATGQQVNIHAYAHEHYIFRNWTLNGSVVSSAAYFSYTMPDHNVTLVANYDYNYQPDSPSEPGQQLGSHYNIYGMRESVMAGQTVNYPLYLQNVGSAAVTGFQIDVTLPQGFVADAQAAALTDRAADHSLQAETTDDGGWRFTVSGATAIDGVEGKVLLLPISVPDTATIGLTFPVKLSGGLVFLDDGRQDSIAVRSGSLKIQRSADDVPDSPDYIVNNVQTTTTDVMPGGTVTIEWQVQNQGNMTGIGGWTERIYLVTPQGRKVNIGSTSYDTTELKPGSTVSRNATVSLAQLPGIDGPADVAVTIVPAVGAGELVDFIGNNTGLTTGQPITVGKRLVLTVPQTPQQEGDVSTIRCQLARSGNWTQDESFQLTKLAGDDRISMPETVVIPREQAAAYFYLPLTNDGECNADSIFAFSIQGNGYEAVDARLIVDDDEMPSLRLTTSTTEVTEGDTFQLTVSLSEPLNQGDITINLSCDHALRFTFPKVITLSAGSTSVSINVTATDNAEPNNTETVEFVASADGYMRASSLVMLHDNDVPDIELALTPDVVSESAGANAVYATLKRTGVTGNKVTLKLSDDSNGRLFYPTTIVLAKGETEKTFNIGTVDNTLVEGEQKVNITAEVYISSCNCGVVGSKQGTVTEQLTVIDDDGPTLTLTTEKTAIREGDATGATITLTRNTSAAEPLVVTLQTEAEGLNMPSQATIPAGQRSTTFVITANNNAEQEDNRLVTLWAHADGYNSGAVWLYVTNMTLPDMAVRSIILSPATILAGDDYMADITIANAGVVAVPARSTYTITTANQTFTMTIPEAIAPYDYVTTSLSLKAPNVPGEYTVEVVCNKGKAFDEVQWLNNAYSVPLKVNPAYTYTVTTDRTNYQMGQTVKMNGQVTALRGSAQGITVEPYVVYHGTRQALAATTDANGHFETEFQLPAGIGGDFAIGVCAPGENSTEAMAKISVYGMARTTATYIKSYMYVGEPFNIKVPIKNLSSLPLHHIKASVSDAESHYRVTAKEIATLDGYAEAEVELTMVSDVVTVTDNWERLWINLSSDEGATLNFVVYNYTTHPGADLVFDLPVIRANITNSKPTTIPVVLTNKGAGKTGRITIDVPRNQTFVTLNTPRELPSMAHGDSTTISITFNPSGLPTNVTQSGTITVNCENADGESISYNLKVVGEDKGNLLVSVEDEFTIYGNAQGEHPLVAGASVQLKDYNTGVALYTKTTTEQGTALFNDIPEGYYTLYVTASKHDSYMQHVLVSPAETTEHLATLSYQAISINYNVEETGVEDQYEIVSEYTYETQVPEPVIVLDAPDELNLYDVEMGHELLYYIKLENLGLITAQNVCVSLPSHDDFLFTPLAEYAGFDLAAKQSTTIPVLVTYAPGAGSRANKAEGEKKPKCYDETWANWEWVCKANRTGWIGRLGKFLMRSCDPNEPTPKDPEPDKDKTQEPTPPDGPEFEPHLYYYTMPQIDLNIVKEVVSTIACSMACFFPSPPLPPESLEDLLYEFIPEQLQVPVCILEELANRHDNSRAKQHAPADNSLHDSYLNRLELYLKLSNNLRNYYAELINAPMLFNDNATVNQLVPSLNSIIERMSDWHSEGHLYNKRIGDIVQTTITMLPQQSTDWYDFNLSTFIERQMNTFRIRDNLDVSGTNFCNIVTLDTCMANKAQLEQEIADMGYIDYIDMIRTMNQDVEAINSSSKSVCATVKMQIKQELAFTRQAFRGTLTIDNSTEEAISDIAVLLQAISEDGTLATSHEMQISLENAEGFTVQDDGNYRLEAGQAGAFTFLFIPTKYAATDHDVMYGFGGTLSFNNGDGVMTRELYPVSLIVRPSPILDLTYFMQRDMLGDDPLTEEVEPIVPAEFALIIDNKGYGDATNVRMVTQQPKIVENEKGLLIDFKLVSSQVNGEPAVLNFSDVITNDFGTIPAKSQSYAQWWLTSTLMGHFIDYDVKATHVTSYGNEDLSLLGDVSIHELIHGFTPLYEFTGSHAARAFLVNDVTDAEDLPDEVYFTDGNRQSVSRAAGATISSLGDGQYLLAINGSTMGWIYGSLADPTNGKMQVASITRQRDGATLPSDNVWQTPVTMRDGQDPVHERRLHFVCHSQGGSETWLINFEQRPQEPDNIEDVQGVAERGHIRIGPLPLATYMYVKGDFSEVRNIEMFDLRGIRLLNTRGMPARQGIYVGQLPAGVYQVRVSTDAGTYHAKVLKR